MKNTIETIVTYINKNTNIKDKRVYMSLLYLNRYILKDTVMRDFGNRSNELADSWLKLLNEKCVFPLKDSKNIELFLEHKFDVLKNVYGVKVVNITKSKFKKIGLYTALADKNINQFIKLLDTLEITIDDIFEIYTRVNMPDKNNMDFFTPMDICTGIGKIASHKDIELKGKISVYDGACGVGNVLYSTYKELKQKNNDIKIEIFGNDIDEMYSTFAESIFKLFNQGNSYFENKNVLLEKVFIGKKMDIVVGNPPFGLKQWVPDEEYMNIFNNNQEHLTKAQKKLFEKSNKSVA